MKKYILSAFLCILTLAVQAQTIYLHKGGTYTAAQLTDPFEINLYALYDSITFTKPLYANPVTVTYDGGKATVNIPDDLQGVKSQVNGADVVITSDNVTDEITYIASGTSANGSLTINGSYKLTLQLNNLSLTSTTGAAIDIQCGKRIALVLPEGSTNSLADAASGAQKACLYCKGHLEVEGSGTLNVTANKSHAISTKEYLQLKKTTGSINIIRSANDAIHVGQYFQMNGGTVNIDANTVGDGIQVEKTTDPADEQNGEVIIKGGVLNVTMASQDTKAIKSDADITISGGTFTILANGNGSRGIQTDGNMVIGSESAETNITITAAGGKCTVPEDKDDPHNCMGIKVDTDLTVNGGTITVYNTGKKAKGIKVGGVYRENGGTVIAEISN